MSSEVAVSLHAFARTKKVTSRENGGLPGPIPMIQVPFCRALQYILE